MTKLEKLKVAQEEADLELSKAYAGLVVRWRDFYDAKDAYQAELKKQEETE